MNEYTIGYMIHEVLSVGPLECNCLILGDEQTGEALVIDPGDDGAEILTKANRFGLKVTSILLTHAHLDHVGAAHFVKDSTAAQIFLHHGDRELYGNLEAQARWLGMKEPAKAAIDHYLRDGEKLKLGESEFLVLHTPGHTPGSVCLWLPEEEKLVAGDTLFRDGVGRTDLPGGDGRLLLASIRDKLLPLPDETDVFPGHGPSTSIGRERRHNYFLRNL